MKVTRVSLAVRVRRVWRESGCVAVFARGVLRAVRLAGSALNKIADFGIKHLPQRCWTHPSDQARLAQNQALRNCHKAQRCFILATGPSLRTQNISGLENEIIFTVNQGFFFAKQKGLKPSYHCMVDAMFLEPEFNSLHSDLTAFANSNGSKLLLSCELADHFNELELSVESYGIRQLINSRQWDDAKIAVPTDLTQAVPGYVSVVHAAIGWAIFMGFKDIYLLGCDMDYFINPEKAYLRCYDEELYVSNSATAADTFAMDQMALLEWVVVEFKAFTNLANTTKHLGISIVNAGEGGALNVFPRMSLENIIQKNSEQTRSKDGAKS